MASLMAMLAQQGSSLQTRKGLILLGLQNDFLSTEGKLPVSTKSGFLDHLKQLVPSFREFGTVIWVRTEFEANREPHSADETGDTVIAGAFAHVDENKSIKDGSKRSAPNDSCAPLKRMKATDAEDDPELFLTRTSTREPCCLRGSWGVEHPSDVGTLVDPQDLQVTKTYYSAFGSTSLLTTLRSRLITELFVCGCNTNLSVFATAMDAARYGIKITLIEDCLGFRKKERHDEAIRQLVDIMEADVLSSEEVIDILKNPTLFDEDDEEDEEESEEERLAHHLARANVSNDPRTRGLSGPSSGLDLAGALDADSDEDDDEEGEEIVLPQVSTSSMLMSRLPLRYMSVRSPPLVADTEHAAEHAQPPDPSPPDASSVRTGEVVATGFVKSKDARGADANDVESEVELAGHGSVGGSADHVEEEGGVFVEAASPSIRPESPATQGEPSKALKLVNDSPTNDSNAEVPEATSTLDRSQIEPVGEALTSGGSNTSLQHAEAFQQADMGSPTAVVKPARHRPLFGDDKEAESADSRLLYKLLPSELASVVFDKLNAEVTWKTMHHQTGEVPRLVCCQGTISEDGSMPVYRHPSDQTLRLQPWSPMVATIREAAERAVGHTLNHVLIQLYRGGTDYISEHSDKTLDIMRCSNIVNVSFGSQRTMRLRTKRGATSAVLDSLAKVSPPTQRTTYRVPLPHNSMLTMSLRTNAEYLHGINADKRPGVEFTEAEKAHDGQRISLTFRHIATFLTADEEKIWGQGAISKVKEGANAVINGDETESARLVRAFGAENAASSIDWEAVYGRGSDVLHLRLKKDLKGE